MYLVADISVEICAAKSCKLCTQYCPEANTILYSEEMGKDLEIAPRDVADLLKQGKVKLLDVRTPEEYQIASVSGSVLVDQSLAQEILQSWPKDTAIVTMCHHGIRSLDAAAYLRGHGFDNTKSMTGGIEAWALQVDPSIPRY